MNELLKKYDGREIIILVNNTELKYLISDGKIYSKPIHAVNYKLIQWFHYPHEVLQCFINELTIELEKDINN
jgi:hypothetical protein